MQIPLHSLVAICGPSGSGKTSLVLGVLAEEADRRYHQVLGGTSKANTEPAGEVSGLPFAIALRAKAPRRNWIPSAASEAGIYGPLTAVLCSLPQSCPECGASLTPQTLAELGRIIADSPPRIRSLQIELPIPSRSRLNELRQRGFSRVRVGEDELRFDEVAQSGDSLERSIAADSCTLVVDRFSYPVDISTRTFRDALKLSLELAGKSILFRLLDENQIECGGFKFGSGVLCPACSFQTSELVSADFNFRSASARCPSCLGAGVKHVFRKELLLAGAGLPLVLGGIIPWMEPLLRPDEETIARLLAGVAAAPSAAAVDLSPAQLTPLLFGTAGNSEFLLSSLKECSDKGPIETIGVCGLLRRLYVSSRRSATRRRIEAYLTTADCPECNGARLRSDVLNRKFRGLSVREILLQSFGQLRDWLAAAKPDTNAAPLLSSLEMIRELGVDYLSVSQSFISLSSGERDRMRLSCGLVSKVQGILYLLDEPLGGLFPHDRERVVSVLGKLVEQGNSLIAAENDLLFRSKSDWVCELGPGGGSEGGRVVRAGAPVPADPISIPETRLPFQPAGFLRFSGVSNRNLRNLDFELPIRALSAIAGPSGSGKSVLLHEVIVPAVRARLASGTANILDLSGVSNLSGEAEFQAVFDAGRSAGGAGRRSTVASFTGLLHHLRELFQMLPGTKITGDSSRARFRGLSWADIQSSTAAELFEVFQRIPPLARILKRVLALGLGYLRINQPAETLSDGELQRLFLLRSLPGSIFRSDAPPALIVFDEPARGLAGTEVLGVLSLFRTLIENGHTVVAVEHDLLFLSQADYLLELGPGGGPDGGRKIANGPVGAVERDAQSLVGNLLVGFHGR